MLKNTYLLAVLLLIALACTPTAPCENARNVESTSIKFLFKDSMTNRFMYTEDFSLFKRDSLKFFNLNGTRLTDVVSGLMINPDSITSNSGRIYAIQLNDIFDSATDSVAYTRELCKDFIIQHLSNVRDTIKVCFKSVKIECGSQQEYIRVFYKGRMLANVPNDIFCTVRLVR
jgi:hypothetical protein